MFLSGTRKFEEGAITAQPSWVPPRLRYAADRHPPATAAGVSLQVSMLTTRSTSPWAYLPGVPARGPAHLREPFASSPGSTGLVGSGRYLVIRGLLQHLRAQIGAELELPAPKIAPGQAQRFHLRAHGCRAPPVKDQGRTQGGRGLSSRGVQLCLATRGGGDLVRGEPPARLKRVGKTTVNGTQLRACP